MDARPLNLIAMLPAAGHAPAGGTPDSGAQPGSAFSAVWTDMLAAPPRGDLGRLGPGAPAAGPRIVCEPPPDRAGGAVAEAPSGSVPHSFTPALRNAVADGIAKAFAVALPQVVPETSDYPTGVWPRPMPAPPGAPQPTRPARQESDEPIVPGEHALPGAFGDLTVTPLAAVPQAVATLSEILQASADVTPTVTDRVDPQPRCEVEPCRLSRSQPARRAGRDGLAARSRRDQRW
jgi:hypothetical protein